MTDAQKRQYVSNLYSGPKWKKRVEKMDDDQVVAIYLGHQKDGTVPHHDEETAFTLPDYRREDAENPLSALPVRELAPRPPHDNEDLFETY